MRRAVCRLSCAIFGQQVRQDRQRDDCAAGKPASLPVAIVESASLPGERVVYTTLAELPTIDPTQFAGPTLLLIGPQFVDRRAVAIDRSLLETLLPGAYG